MFARLPALAIASACAAVWLGIAPFTVAAPKPNIVFILADNLGYGDLACYGARDMRTPNIDRLAAEGVRFTNFYSNAPDCTPARTALMTGRYQHRIGGLECAIGIGGVGRYDDAMRLADRHELGLPAAENTLVRLLKRAGYRCVGFGKWHLGYETKFLPPAHGFDRYLGLLSGCTDYFYHRDPSGSPVLFENDRIVTREGYSTDLFTEEAVKFITSEGREAPFFLYLPYNAPSAPFLHPDHKPPAPLEPGPWDSPRWQSGTRETLAAIVHRLDQGVGRVLETLDRCGLASNTLVVFASDNGAYPIAASNGPFTGHAHELFEGGIHVPCVVRWPGVLPRGLATDRVTMLFDLSRSMLAAAACETPSDRPLDGIDILDDIRNNRAAQGRTLFWRARRGDRTWRAVREAALKYITMHDGTEDREYLFNLQYDSAEKDNLAASRTKDVERLRRLLSTWERDVRAAR